MKRNTPKGGGQKIWGWGNKYSKPASLVERPRGSQGGAQKRGYRRESFSLTTITLLKWGQLTSAIVTSEEKRDAWKSGVNWV